MITLEAIDASSPMAPRFTLYEITDTDTGESMSVTLEELKQIVELCNDMFFKMAKPL